MKGSKLADLFLQDKPIISPGCFDALSALLIQQAGFSCASISGAAVTASMLGLPDYGFVGLEEMTRLVQQITLICDIPILVDCESGYGNALTALRAMQSMQKAGAACVCFQDEKKHDGTLMSSSEMQGMLHAAIDGRAEGDTLLMARTDALASAGIDEALRRAQAYIEAGADLIFIDGIQSPSDFEAVFNARLGVPLKYNNAIKQNGEQYTAQQLSEKGFKLITYSASLQKAAIKAMQGLLMELSLTGRTQGWIDKKISQCERATLLGTQQWKEKAKKYIG